jgi:hypothetical protein
MPLYKFSQNDLFHNRVETHPQCNFFFYKSGSYYNKNLQLSGAFTSSVPIGPVSGGVSLYQMNVDRVATNSDVAAAGTILVLDDDEITAGAAHYIKLVATNGTVYNLTAHATDTTTEHTLSPTFDINELGPDFTAGEIQKAINALDDFKATWAGLASDGVSTEQSRTVTITQLTPGHLGNTTIEGFGSLVSSGDAVTLSGFSGGNSYSHIYSYIIKDSDNYVDYRRPRYVVDGAGRNQLLITAAENGDVIIGDYPMSASVSKEYFQPNHLSSSTRDIIRATDIGSGEPDFLDAYTEHPNDQTIRLGRHPLYGSTDADLAIATAIESSVDEYGLSPKSTLGSKISALKNTLDSYIVLSKHYAYSSASLPLTGSDFEIRDAPSIPGPDRRSWSMPSREIVNWNKGEQEMGLLSIPSIYYGRQIQKGTVSLKFYITGTLIGELQDKNKNGELIQVGPTGSVNSGSVAGVVLYNEGFMLLTGSWDLTANPVKSSADLNFTKAPANNDTVTLINSAGTEKVFKFNTGNSTVDGTLHSDESSVNVGIAGSPANGGANRFKNAVDNADFDITATRSSGVVTLTQDTAGTAGNTDITIVSSVITGPTPSKFSNGMGGAFSPPHTELYGVDENASAPRWIDFAQTIATGSSAAADMSMLSSSFELNFKGTNYVPTMTMLAHARKGHLNFSNNSTYIKHGQEVDPASSSIKFEEKKELQIKNIVSSSYESHTASYRRQTYISKIGIYDAKRNLIGIAKVATPVKKTEERDFTFKLKLDF